MRTAAEIAPARPVTSQGAKPGPAPRARATNRPQPAERPTLRPLDRALITLGIAVVAALIWFGLGGTTAQEGSGSGSSNNPGGVIPPDFNTTPVPAGQPAPDFSLPGADGQTYSLQQFRGQAVVLEFFGPWCPHCQQDAPIFAQLYEAYKDKKVQMLAVSASPYGRNYQQGDETPITMDDLTWFRDTFGVPFPLLLDKELKATSAYGITRYPTTYIVDANGVVASQVPNPRPLKR